MCEEVNSIAEERDTKVRFQYVIIPDPFLGVESHSFQVCFCLHIVF